MVAERPSRRQSSTAGFMVIGSEMSGATLFGLCLDIFVFGTLPWLTIVFTMLGMALAFYHLVVFSRGFTKGTDTDDVTS